MTDLDKLIEAVEAGDNDLIAGALAKFDRNLWDPVVKSYNGSLDAAKALHEALLPGWEFQLVQKHQVFVCLVAWDGIWHSALMAEGQDPARAWLIAILKAYRSTQEASQ